jgi:alpha-mannosidase
MNRYFQLATADLVVPNQDACMLFQIPLCTRLKLAAGHLMWDFSTLREIVDTVPGNTALQNKALVTANKIMNVFKSGDPENVERMRGIAEDVFGKGWQAKGDKIYNEGPKKAQVVGISYCHIVSYHLRSRVMSHMFCFNRIQHGCGLIRSLSRRQRGPGPPRSI